MTGAGNFVSFAYVRTFGISSAVIFATQCVPFALAVAISLTENASAAPAWPPEPGLISNLAEAAGDEESHSTLIPVVVPDIRTGPLNSKFGLAFGILARRPFAANNTGRSFSS